jgi:hypothetical protein
MPKVPIALDIELRFALWAANRRAQERERADARAAAEAKRAKAERKAIIDAQ